MIADPQRDDASGEALQGAADDHGRERVAQPCDDRAGHQHGQADQQHASLAVHVAEPPDDGRRDRAGEQTVSAQVVSAAEAPRSAGSLGTSGMTRVCISETTIPANASTTTTGFARGRRVDTRRAGEVTSKGFKSVA
jgi:hypothetical protein